MSPRFLTVAALCFGLVVCGCEKKEKTPEVQPVRVVKARAAVPEGMAPIGDSGTVFISTQPLMIGEYLDYLRGTGQPVPEKWKDLTPASPETARAVTGLDKEEAGRCAAWLMKRVPTLKEWQEAVRVVGARPYPWLEDGEPVPQGAPILLVQDWAPKTQGELDAREAKAALAQKVLEDSQAEFRVLRGDLQAAVTARQERQKARWEAFKPAFFELLDKRKAVAEAEARREGRALALEVLTKLAQEKGKLAIALKTQDLSAEAQDEAVGAYGRTVGELRGKMQDVRNELNQACAEMQQQVVGLTQALETAGSPEQDALLASASELLARFQEAPQTTSEALAANEALQQKLEELKNAPEALAGVPSVDDLRAQGDKLDEQLKEAEAGEPTPEAVKAERDRLERLGQSVEREFVQEGILANELTELIDLRARKAALESRVKGLKEMLPQR